MSTAATDIVIVPYGEDPLQALAGRLLADTAGEPCRLAETTVLIPDLEAAARLRQRLLAAQGGGALLGPRITTLHGWLEQHTPSLPPLLDAAARPLLLVEALRQHRRLFGEVNLWALADALLTLFDELTLAQSGIGPDVEGFVARLATAYGLPADAQVAALGFEARVVHTLWHAWHEQLQARQRLDPAAAHLLRLAADQGPQAASHRLYLAGFTDMAPAELAWLRQRLEAGHACLFLHGPPAAPTAYHPGAPVAALLRALDREPPAGADPDPLAALLEDALEPGDTPLLTRATAFRRVHPASPAEGRLALFSADGAEQEAAAVELQIRRWLLAGHRRIGVVTESRRLARRLRALLERAGIALQDAAGWALSTTSAAAALERWLECVEEDFPHRAMLDLLKSPFVFPDQERDQRLAAVYRLEQDLIRHEGIGQGLERYRRHLDYRRRRLGAAVPPATGAVARLLEQLAAARERLGGSAKTAPRPASQWLAALGASLDVLGMGESLAADAAGARLLEELAALRRATADEDPPLAWVEFRAWLGRTLEQATFRPPALGAPVVLLGLGQSRLSRFDALVVAAAEREHLPGASHASPFFNDAVRRDLGLKTGEQRHGERFHHFRRLLQAAPQVLITLRHAQDGEEVMPSPWVALLQAFHRLAYGHVLGDNGLGILLGQPGTRVRPSVRPPPPPPTRRPAPAAPPALLPQEVSASAYQQLVACPYRFFAARCLGLSAPEEVREALEKSDYGQRVHRCLEAFHGDIEGLPGPFDGQLTPARKAEAVALLERIAAAVFAQDLEDNFVHRGWLERWRELLPAYVEWELRHQEAFGIVRVEAELDRLRPDFPPGIALRGRIDRLEQGTEGAAVVDYKTGYVPSDEMVESGESVQLPFYALLAEQPIVRSEYLHLDAGRARSRGSLAAETLAALAEANGERLSALFRALGTGAPMPAWGDEGTCGLCDMDGVCRRAAWSEEAAGAGSARRP